MSKKPKGKNILRRKKEEYSEETKTKTEKYLFRHSVKSLVLNWGKISIFHPEGKLRAFDHVWRHF